MAGGLVPGRRRCAGAVEHAGAARAGGAGSESGAKLLARCVLERWIKMRILIISPFAAERIALEELLRLDGHLVTSAASGMEGLSGEDPPDAVIADAQLPGLDGSILLRQLSDRGPLPRVILVCPRASRVRWRPGVVCLTKPIDLAELHRHLAPRPAAEAAA